MAEAFVWGQGGAKLTPEQLALAKAVLARKKSQGVDTSPVGHWTAGAARVVDALGDVFQERRLNSQQAENDQYNMAQTEPLIAALTGGGAAPVVTAAPVDSGSAPVASQPQTSAAAVAAPVFANDGTELGAILSNNELRATLPAGMRNNNPGNIKFVGQKVPGIVGPSVNTDQGDPQAVFDSPESGMRAMHALLNRKYTGGKLTPNQMIAGNMGWTPGNYGAAANVAKTMGISPDEDIGFNNPERAAKFMQALILQEHGQKGRLYPTSLITSAITGTPSATPAAQAIEQAAPSSGYVDPMVSVQPNAMAPELPAPVEVATRSVASAPVSAPVAAPQQTAPSPSAIAQALRVIADPRANDNTKAVAQALIQRQQVQEQAAQEQSIWQQRQAYQQQQQNSDPLRQAQIAQAQAQAEKLRRDAANPNGDETFYGNTVAIQNQDGSIAYGQMGNKGTFRPIQLPEGQSFAPPTRTIDAGTETVVMDQAGNVISRVPKQNRAAAAETAGGTVEGRTAAEKQIAAPADFQSAQNAMDILDQIENHPARKAGTGGTSIFNAIPGTSGYDFQNLVNQAKSGAFLTAIESMKGLGALSNAEGGAATAAVTRMDTATTEEGFMSALNDYRKIVTQGMERARRNIPESQRPATEQQQGEGWKDLGNGVKIRPKGSN